MRRVQLLSVALSLLLLPFEAGATPVLFGVDSASDALTVVDPVTGVVTPFPPLGAPGEFPVPVSLARDPSTSALYTWNNNSGTNGLVLIDPTTGAGTHVNPGGPSPERNFGAISFAADGNLYAISASEIWQIDLVSGAPTAVSMPFLPDMSGMDLSGAGELFATTSAGWLYRNVDPLTGTFDGVAEMMLDGGGDLDSLVQSIVFSPGGSLLGAGFRFAQFETVEYTFNFTTGLVELDGQAPGEFGSAVEIATGYRYFFLPSGEIVAVQDADGTPLGDFDPSTSALEETVQTEEARNVLFDIDPTTGIVANLRDVIGPGPQGLAYVPEPASSLLVLTGLAALAARRRR